MSPQSNYSKFFCKCSQEFQSFSEFLIHLKDSHQIEQVNYSEILAQRNDSKIEIKFYWHLSCQCGHKFSSSLCNADLKIHSDKKQIELVKKYYLQCLKCGQIAKFDREKLLNKFLKQRIKQILIYSFYEEKFSRFNGERSGKVLKDHKQDLCEKCQQLKRYCGDE
ncbi:19792_t:CDS:1 [Cetraspora pellucida]|uniref:19792_t:CDS:1 n=1 Tax=Cetraspora pellucida TaxID=1433469 RepID=A0A9N9F2W1_9GLOM|nr:19792_t:CDS:1 [Cetraspora pellucida]